MFLKNKNIIFKIRRSKVTDYAALNCQFMYSDKGICHRSKFFIVSYRSFQHKTDFLNK